MRKSWPKIEQWPYRHSERRYSGGEGGTEGGPEDLGRASISEHLDIETGGCQGLNLRGRKRKQLNSCFFLIIPCLGWSSHGFGPISWQSQVGDQNTAGNSSESGFKILGSLAHPSVTWGEVSLKELVQRASLTQAEQFLFILALAAEPWA